MAWRAKNVNPVRAAAAAARQYWRNRRGFRLLPGTVAYNIHCAVSGRNCSDPVARLRNAGVSGHGVAQLLVGLDDLLRLWPEHDVLARISSNRCAKRERKRDACTSDRPAAQATWSAYCFHALSVIPLQILRKPIFPLF
jgi:hypothetical protein